MMQVAFTKNCFLLLLFIRLSLGLSSTSPIVAWEDEVEASLPDSWNEQIEWRSIGPANMMGRITSIAVYEKDKNIWWAASAGGGLLKTMNNGITFEHQFDNQATVSIGDVQVSRTDPNLLWVGTGEANPRNSVSWGDGVYKSADGGKSWKNMGLKKTFQTGRIAIHPEDHDIVYVGALGRLWGPNEERGLFKTIDGGKTWDKIFFVDEKTGVVDVQMNPDNPKELLIATYERRRDGFDGNDPENKYGDGSAIYKTVDAGKTFRRLSQGLPSCKLGRIGLCYYSKNPNYIAAIIESEKIAKEPESAAFAGLRGQDAEVGAKITKLTEDGPAAKAGLKENDIVVSVEGDILYSYQDLQSGIRKQKAGDTIKLVVSRDRKPVDIVIELANKPKPEKASKRRSIRTPFTGTLGGQAANLQGQQGDNEQDYGGVYLSKDGGDSWERINTLNPRPMYYSQIRIDPTDRKNIYVLGTSLYRSKDGGKTFSADGGKGTHVDHHAMWIDPDDSRHMILGNDGGVYVTYDRMENWDHHNHAAIGQFYHVGVGSRLDYRVYGGLQDNGSWGGPVRVSDDSGSINSDWFRVGSGDGFITLVDPDDPDQIYFESQNGSMGRTNLRTGDRGFIRPRPPRGTKYRFNWKTPFILSPHNSKIHYSAGNHVFRSLNKGSGIKSISPDITNTDKGAGSAITESPVQAGVLYVGTTDGAVWMTKDGGHQWVSIYSKKEARQDDKSAGSEDGATDETPGTKLEKVEAIDSDSKPARLNGIWNGKMVSDRFPDGQSPTVTLSLKADDNGKVTGEIETRRGQQEITSGHYDIDTGKLSFVIKSERGNREFSAVVKGSMMSGDMTARNGQFKIEFEAAKQEDPDERPRLGVLNPLRLLASVVVDVTVHDDDPLSGEWTGTVVSDQLPGGEVSFEITFKLDSKNTIEGVIDSPRGVFEIADGQFNRKHSKLYFTCDSEQITLDFEAVLVGETMSGDVLINDTLTAEFEAKLEKRHKTKSTEEHVDVKNKMTKDSTEESGQPENLNEIVSESTKPERGFLGVVFARKSKDLFEISRIIPGSGAEQAGLQAGDIFKSINGTEASDFRQLLRQIRARQKGDTIDLVISRDGEEKTISVVLGGMPDDEVRQNSPKGDVENLKGEAPFDSPASSTDQKTERVDDAVSGTWEGTLTSARNESDLTLVLKWKSDKEIAGNYETTRSEGEITEGAFDTKKDTLFLAAANDQFTLEFNGKLEGDSYEGEVEFNGGRFSMEFQLKRTSRSQHSEDKTGSANEEETKTNGKPLEELLPGPRWVSSLHASMYKAERCYVSFDGHRSNDDKPYLFMTSDFGKSWVSIQGNLPDSAGCVRVLREDIKNENILYLGCEFGAWVSIDRGKTWTKFKSLPTVSVHEIAQHPTLDDIVAATHGRSLWVADVTALRQLKPEANKTATVLYKPRDVISWERTARRGSSGTRKFVGSNTPTGAKLSYSLGKKARGLELEILNIKGEVVKRFDNLAGGKGLHSVKWNLRRSRPGQSSSRFGPNVRSGEYLLKLHVDGELFRSTLTVKDDPNRLPQMSAEKENLKWWMEFAGETGK